MSKLIKADEVKKRFPIMENDFGLAINKTLHKELDKIPTVDAIIIPDGATYGDMFMAMFPNCKVSTHEYMGIKCGIDVKIYRSENESFTSWVPSSLWNAPYKKGVE